MISSSDRRETSGSVRMGPVTLISLVVILCLAVLAVLTVNTARANSAQAQRQQEFATSTYSNEFAAQRFLSDVDLALGEAEKTKASKSETMSLIRAASPDAASVKGSTVRIAFATKNGRRLTVEVEIEDDYTYRIVQWTASTDWIEEDTSTSNLWDGNEPNRE